MTLCNKILRHAITGVLLPGYFIFHGGILLGQAGVSGYLDMGVNQVSEGPYLRTALKGHYTVGRYGLETGIQGSILGRDQVAFSGLNLMAYRKVKVSEFPFEVRGFMLYNSHAGLLNETNFGVLAHKRWPHFTLLLGNEFRSYRFKRRAVEDFGYEKGERIREKWNLIYSLGYHLKHKENHWDLGLSITNLDHFLINQETNPFLKLHGRFRAGPSLGFFSEAWYKSSGSFNLSVNYFGFFIRTGITWDMQKK